MTSQLNVDTIVDKAGSGGSNVKMANTSTYVSEGGAVTQNTVQGLTKAWFTSSSAMALTDSFNLASVTDVAAGQLGVTTSTAFANTTYSSTGSCSTNSNINVVTNWNVTVTTTLTRYGMLQVQSQAYLDGGLSGQICGDLA